MSCFFEVIHFILQVRLSETSPKSLNIHHQSERRLQYQLNDILRSRHRAIEESVVNIQKLATESTMRVTEYKQLIVELNFCNKTTSLKVKLAYNHFYM